MPRSKDNGEYAPADFDNPEIPEGQELSEAPEGLSGQDDPENPGGQGASETPDNPGSQDNSAHEPPEKSGLVTIEELAEKLKVGKPVLAAVKQSEGWAEGKKVPETVFKAAVDAFLGAPMGGKTEPPEEGGEQKPSEGDKQ
ncbi:MAG: hypothetical protein LBL20_02760 [Treponema sp.]|jgi:hypothetical protein|nr:hypothetical protein [Treponema sp.]